MLPHLGEIEGFRGAQLWRRSHETQVEFVAVTTFDSLAAVRQFAGCDSECQSDVIEQSRMPLSLKGSMYYLLLYKVVDDFIQRRTAYRPAHLKLADEAEKRGELLLAGAYGDPIVGAALVFRAEDESVPTRFAESDPYVREGLVSEWTVHSWNVVVTSLPDHGTPGRAWCRPKP